MGTSLGEMGPITPHSPGHHTAHTLEVQLPQHAVVLQHTAKRHRCLLERVACGGGGSSVCLSVLFALHSSVSMVASQKGKVNQAKRLAILLVLASKTLAIRGDGLPKQTTYIDSDMALNNGTRN